MILMASRARWPRAAPQRRRLPRGLRRSCSAQARRAGDPALARRHVRPAARRLLGRAATSTRPPTSCSTSSRRTPTKVDGIKVSLLDADARDRAAARGCPRACGMYTGDDFNYPALIRGDGQARDALLGIFDAIAPGRRGRAARARRRRPATRYEALLAPTVPLAAPHLRRAHARTTRPGVVFLAYLNGHQQHFRMVGGLESGALGRCTSPSCSCSPTRPGCCATPSSRSSACGSVLALAGVERDAPARLSFNPITADRWSAAPRRSTRCAEHGLEWIGAVAAQGGRDRRGGGGAADRATPGLQVSSLCRGGFFTAGATAGRRRQPARGRGGRRARHRRARARLRAAAGRRDLAAARADDRARASSACSPHATEHGVRLGIEPLHPMMVGERSAIVTLGEALGLAERIGDPGVGVVIDVYHVFWDPRLDGRDRPARRADRRLPRQRLARARPRDTLLERGMMGDGIIDLRGFSALIDAAGYDGPIEVEILNPAIWDLPRAELMRTTVERFEQCVL